MEQVQLQVSSQPQQQDTQAPATITQAPPLNLQQPQEAGSQQQNDQYEAFKLFLSTAPVNWSANESIRRFNLPDGTSVSCVLWNELFHITGTDIVKALTYRFECLGRTITLQKKFEEGIFSDLRNLKPMSDSTLEESRSPFLKFLYENQCIRTQKKQKVFYWFSVNHDKLFLDALERDLKRENVGQQPCTVSRVPISMIKSMEMAKAQCMQKMAGNHSMKKYPVSAPQPISNDHPTPRISSVSHSASSGHHQYAPILNYSHPMDHLPQRSYSPFQPAANHQNHVLHPGSPPQGLLTPPLMHQQYNGASLQIHPMEHDTYRIHRTDSPLGIHRTDSPLGIHRTDSPSHSLLSYQDVASPHMHSYDGAHVLSSMFNPHEFSAPSHYGNNSNTRYSPYQNTMQAPVAIRRPASAGPSHSPQMMQHMDVSSSERMFECPQPGCHRQFKRQEHCKRHFRSHTGEKPYTCLVPECRRSFSRQDHLQQHMRSHSETGFRLDDNILQNLVHSPQSDFSFPHQSPSVSTYGSIDYHPMRSDSRLSMHSSFEPLMSIPASASTPSVAPAPAPTSSAPGVESTEADDAATKAAVLAVEQVAAASQQDSIPTAAESTETSGKVREEYAQNMEYAMQNLLSIEPEMKFDSYQ